MYLVITEVDEATGEEKLIVSSGANISAPKGSKPDVFKTFAEVAKFAGDRKVSVDGVDISVEPELPAADRALTLLLSNISIKDNYPQRLKAVQTSAEELGRDATVSLIYNAALALLKKG